MNMEPGGQGGRSTQAPTPTTRGTTSIAGKSNAGAFELKYRQALEKSPFFGIDKPNSISNNMINNALETIIRDLDKDVFDTNLHLNCERAPKGGSKLIDGIEYNLETVQTHFDIITMDRQTTKANKILVKKEGSNHYIFPNDSANELRIGDKLSSSGLKNVIITIQVFNNYSNTFQRSQILQLHGNQTLADLRDKIHCIHDKSDGHQPASNSMFCIEDQLFDDTRKEGHLKYSENLIGKLPYFNKIERSRWSTLEQHKYKLGNLNIVLGNPYLFLHQGYCEHYIFFTKRSLRHITDCQYNESYPVETFKRFEMPPYCSICSLHLVSKVTYYGRVGLGDPTFFCEKCFGPTHTTADGSVLQQSKEYREYNFFPE